MRAFAAAVVEDLFAVATSVHQGVAKERHALELAVVVNEVGEIEAGGGDPEWIERVVLNALPAGHARGAGSADRNAHRKSRSFVSLDYRRHLFTPCLPAVMRPSRAVTGQYPRCQAEEQRFDRAEPGVPPAAETSYLTTRGDRSSRRDSV